MYVGNPNSVTHPVASGLLRSVQCACSPPALLTSLIPTQALGTSYVNELDSQKALHNLKAWVQHNPKYSGLEIAVDEYSDGTLMDEVRGIDTITSIFTTTFAIHETEVNCGN